MMLKQAYTSFFSYLLTRNDARPSGGTKVSFGKRFHKLSCKMEALEADLHRRTYAIQSLSHDAEVAGTQTVHSLAQHGEQLDKIRLSLVSVDATLIDTRQNIGRLKSMTRQVIDSVRTKLHQKIFSKVLLHSAIKRNSSSSPSTPVVSESIRS